MSNSLSAKPWSTSSEVTTSRTRSPLRAVIVFGLNSNRRAVILISRCWGGSASGWAAHTIEKSRMKDTVMIPVNAYFLFISVKLLGRIIKGAMPNRESSRSREYKRLPRAFPTPARLERWGLIETFCAPAYNTLPLRYSPEGTRRGQKVGGQSKEPDPQAHVVEEH